MPKLLNGSKGRIRTLPLSIASPTFYHRANVLHINSLFKIEYDKCWGV